MFMFSRASRASVDRGALVSILCTCIGTGILQLPLTLKQGGWLCVALIFLVAAVTNTTGRWLIKCLYAGGGSGGSGGSGGGKGGLAPRLNDYPAVGEAACGTCGRITVQIFHKLTLLGVTTIFMVLTAKFLLEGIGGGGEGFVPSLGAAEDAAAWQKRYAVIAGVCVWFPVVFIKTMKEIAPLAYFGMLASLLCVLEIVVFALIIKPVTAESVHEFNLPVPPTFFNSTGIKAGGSVAHHLFQPGQFPVAFSAITLSFGGHAVFPDIEKAMPDRAKFATTFNLAYAVLLVVYLLAAVFGFFTFGDITYSPILCNFPRSTSTVMGAVTASTKLLIAFHVMSAYPILMTVMTTEIEQSLGWTGEDEDYEEAAEEATWTGDSQEAALLDSSASTPGKTTKSSTSGSFVKRMFLRTFLVATTVCVAVFVPFFGLLMELVGALCLTMMVFVLPVVFSWRLWGDRMSMLQKVFGLFIVAVGGIGGTIGTAQALRDIAKSLSEGKHE
jgi:amino acid permease